MEPRIILFDIEILADLGRVMENMKRVYEGIGLKADISTVVSFGWKVLGDPKVHCINAWDFPKRWKKNTNDDYEVVKAAYEILSKADGAITHYGGRHNFDLDFINSRLAFHNLPPIPPMPHVDTCLVARGNLKLSSNRLDNLARFLGVETKTQVDWSMWTGVSRRDPSACKKMSDYCKQDVIVLEKVYGRLLPFVTTGPNRNIFSNREKHLCPSCGSDHIIRKGDAVTCTATYQRWQCQKCGKWSRTDKSGRNMR